MSDFWRVLFFHLKYLPQYQTNKVWKCFLHKIFSYWLKFPMKGFIYQCMSIEIPISAISISAGSLQCHSFCIFYCNTLPILFTYLFMGKTATLKYVSMNSMKYVSFFRFVSDIFLWGKVLWDRRLYHSEVWHKNPFFDEVFTICICFFTFPLKMEFLKYLLAKIKCNSDSLPPQAAPSNVNNSWFFMAPTCLLLPRPSHRVSNLSYSTRRLLWRTNNMSWKRNSCSYAPSLLYLLLLQAWWSVAVMMRWHDIRWKNKTATKGGSMSQLFQLGSLH